MSFNQAVKKAQKDLDKMKPKQPMRLPMKSEANHLADISTTHKNMDGSPIGASVARALEKGRKQQGSRAGKTYAQMSRGEKAADTKRHYAMLDKMRKGTGPLKTEEKMTPGQAAMKKLDNRPSNVALRNAIANVNRKAQDKINQRTKKAKADSKPR